MKKILSFFIVFCLLLGCSTNSSRQFASVSAESKDSLSYAQGFSIQYFEDFVQVEVRDPWDTTKLLQRYLIIERNKQIPDNLPKGTIVKVPVQKAVIYTSVHASIVEQLKETQRIVGVCEARYMDSPEVRKRLDAGKIIDLGEATSPNVEKIIEIGADVIIASPFQNSSFGPVEKLGIPIIQGADYLESLPLGRTEWVKFYGLLFGKKNLADSVFVATERNYLNLKELATKATSKPTVFAEKRYGSSWYVAGGNSYIANLYKDAGVNYLFKYLSGSDSRPLSFETVFEKAYQADYWLIKYNQSEDLTYKSLRQEYTPYENFDAFKNKRIYGCNTGNVRYYEEFPLHPDYLLKDYIKIFHPELLPNDTLRYYKLVTD